MRVYIVLIVLIVNTVHVNANISARELWLTDVKQYISYSIQGKLTAAITNKNIWQNYYGWPVAFIIVVYCTRPTVKFHCDYFIRGSCDI